MSWLQLHVLVFFYCVISISQSYHLRLSRKVSHKIFEVSWKNKFQLSWKVSWKSLKWVEFQNLKSLPGLLECFLEVADCLCWWLQWSTDSTVIVTLSNQWIKYCLYFLLTLNPQMYTAEWRQSCTAVWWWFSNQKQLEVFTTRC